MGGPRNDFPLRSCVHAPPVTMGVHGRWSRRRRSGCLVCVWFCQAKKRKVQIAFRPIQSEPPRRVPTWSAKLLGGASQAACARRCRWPRAWGGRCDGAPHAVACSAGGTHWRNAGTTGTSRELVRAQAPHAKSSPSDAAGRVWEGKSSFKPTGYNTQNARGFFGRGSR